MKLIVTSDTHYGLNSGGYDRTPEIHQVFEGICERAMSGADYLIHCGDLGQTNHPKAETYGLWIRIWERLHEESEIKARFLVGNHDVIHRRDNCHGSLQALAELRHHRIEAISGPVMESLGPGWYAVYLPYLSKSHQGEKDLQEQTEGWLRTTLDGLSEVEGRVLVFAHWDVEGADLGGDRLMRPTSLAFPEWVCDHPAVVLAVSGHIHNHQTIHKGKAPHIIVGSPIHTDFGDMGEKKYLEIDLTDQGQIMVRPVDSGATRFVELVYDLVENDLEALRFHPAQVKDAVVKVSVRCTEDQRESIDWEAFRESMAQEAAFVRPIRPVVVREQAHQPVKIQKGLQDDQMVMAWLRDRKPPDAKRIGEFALEAMLEF